MQANFTLHDHGCGTVTAMRMIAAEVLKVPEDKIYMTEGDTAVTPIDYGCFASRTTYVVGRAVQDAANTLRKKMLHAASTLLDIPEDELFLNDSHICRAGQDEPLLSFAELAKKSMHTHAGNLTACVSYSNVTNPGVTALQRCSTISPCTTSVRPSTPASARRRSRARCRWAAALRCAKR